MNTTLQAMQAVAWLPWTDIAFIVSLTLLYSRILHWMQRDNEFLYIEEILAHVYLVYLVIFCGLTWIWRGMLTEMKLDSAPWLKYGMLVIPAMAHEIVTKRTVLDLVARPGQMNGPFKVQYGVSIIFVTFCWTYLSNLE